MAAPGQRLGEDNGEQGAPLQILSCWVVFDDVLNLKLLICVSMILSDVGEAAKAATLVTTSRAPIFLRQQPI